MLKILNRAVLAGIFSAGISTSSMAKVPESINSIISDIESSKCSTQMYSETSQLSEEIQKRLGIKIEDCILKSLESIEGIGDILVGLYKNNPQQLEIDLQNGLFPLLTLITGDTEKINKIINFHEKTPSFYFGIDVVFFWDALEGMPDFPLKEMAIFLEGNETKHDIKSERGRKTILFGLRKITQDGNPDIFSLKNEKAEETEFKKYDLNELKIFFTHYKKWGLSEYFYDWDNGLSLIYTIKNNNLEDTLERLSNAGIKLSGEEIYMYPDNDKLKKIIETIIAIPEIELINRVKNIPIQITLLYDYELITNKKLNSLYGSLIVDIPREKQKDYTFGFLAFSQDGKIDYSGIKIFHKLKITEYKGNFDKTYNQYNNQYEYSRSPLEKQICAHPLLVNCSNVFHIFTGEGEILEKKQQVFLDLINAVYRTSGKKYSEYFEDDPFNRKGAMNRSFSWSFQKIFGNDYQEGRILKLIEIINKGGNFQPEVFENFILPGAEAGEDHLYNYGLSSQQEANYIELLSIIEGSGWDNSKGFSLLNKSSDNRDILDIDFIDTAKLIYNKTGTRIKFSDFYIVWEMKNNSELLEEFLSFEFDELKTEVSDKLKQTRHTHRIIKYKNLYSEGTENLDKLDHIELFKIYMILKMLDKKEVKETILENIQNDKADNTTEYGGNVVLKPPYFEVTPPRKKVGDGSFRGPFNLAAYSKNISVFHQHAVGTSRMNMSYYAGPSGPDLRSAKDGYKTGIVITEISEHIFNVDYYNENGVVLDLGNYNGKY